MPADEPAGARCPVRSRLTDRRVIALGVVIGLAALTRNEAIWLGFIWLLIAWRAARLRLVVAVGAIALLVFAPWMIRDWLVFGSPLPGQAVANAFSVTGLDIFAWNDPPTLSRYLAVGPARLARDARRRAVAQPVHGPAAAGRADLGHRPAPRCRGRPAGPPSGRSSC